ncbi:hypothetical protein ACMHYJ_05285 [Castellaniella hirudinis]|uniref:hypothetical protein n=1 Tax=Castellaniella hirudinis TaxID=1144617 RepID=UPI0039C25FE3
MSKKIAPTRGEGISTPQIIAEATQSGNTFSVAAFAKTLDTKILDHAVEPMQTAVDAFSWISTLASIAKQKHVDDKTVAVSDLLEIISYIADDIGNFTDCEREMLRDDHLPRLLASLPNGGAS